MLPFLLACAAPDPADTTPAEADADTDADTDADSDADSDTDTDTDAGPATWSGDIFPVYQRACGDCHFGWGGPGDPAATYDWVSTESYEGVPLVVPGDHAASLLWSKVAEDPTLAGEPMPLQVPDMADADLQGVYDWIAAGARNDDSFRVVAALFHDYACEDCHGEWEEPSLYQTLTTRVGGGGAYPFVEPGDPDASAFYLKIASETPPYGRQMPLRIPLLEQAEIDAFASWIDAGARED